MLTNAKQITTIAILIAVTSSIATYAWNNQTLSEMVEEHNQQILSDCLTKARVQKSSKEILEYASNCNKDILTNISTPRSVETITWTHSTGNTVPPLWFQLIPQASAKEKYETGSVGSVQNNLKQKYSSSDDSHSQISASVKSVEKKTRTPKQIYEQVKHLWYREAPTISLISTCKASSQHVQKCILVWLVLMYNEAGNQQNSKACIERNNCFGINSWKKVYSILDEWMENWVQKFNRYWYKADSAKYFYPDLWKESPTKYCYSEIQHYPNIWCPDGQKIATDKWSKLYPIIY